MKLTDRIANALRKATVKPDEEPFIPDNRAGRRNVVRQLASRKQRIEYGFGRDHHAAPGTFPAMRDEPRLSEHPVEVVQ